MKIHVEVNRDGRVLQLPKICDPKPQRGRELLLMGSVEGCISVGGQLEATNLTLSLQFGFLCGVFQCIAMQMSDNFLKFSYDAFRV